MAVLSTANRQCADHSLKKFCRAAFVLLALLLLGEWATWAQPAVPKEYQLKAAFLFNFAQFAEWPRTAFTNTDSPLCIGVLGENPFGKALEETVQGETIHGHKLAVRHSRQIEDLKDCQMIFISKSEKSRTAEILSTLRSHPVLSVSEIEGFARRGGVINFYLDGNKVRFEINPAIAQREGLKMSSQLLSLGKIVQPEPVKENK